MSSTSRKSFASRLGNAKTLATIIESFTDYVPPKQEASLTTLQKSIEDLQTLMNQHSAAQIHYREVVKQRVQVFDKDDDSVDKLLSPIGTFVKALLGSESTTYTELNRIIKRMRGAVKPATLSSEEEETRQISTIERTYDSRTQDFNLIVNLLESLGEAYSPPNTQITLGNLQVKLSTLQQANLAVSKALTNLKPLVQKRQEDFIILTQQVQSIKNFIKAQYGMSSAEYKQVKSLVI